MDWYPWFTKKYRSKTMHLRTIEHGAYRLLIDEYMDLGAPISSSPVWICRITGLSADEWHGMATTIMAFFDPLPDGKRMSNPMCDEQLGEQAKFRFKEAARKKKYRDEQEERKAGNYPRNGRSH